MSKSYKLVVSRYQENLDWVDAFDSYQIYNKGKSNLKPIHLQNAIVLSNKGRESQTYLNHIIENYDNLEDIVIFSQGNYRAHVHMSPEDFKQKALDIDQYGFSIDLSNISGRIGDNSSVFTLKWHGGDLYPKEPYKLGEWWEKTTGEPYVRSKSVFWGATFSVKKEFILKRSLESYKRLISTVDWDVNPLEGHFCERTWFNILNLPLDFELDPPQATQITVPDIKFNLKEFLANWDPETLSFKKEDENKEKEEKPEKKEIKIKVKFKDYNTYLENQNLKNKNKLKNVYVSDKELIKIGQDIKARIENPQVGICHGSRNGYEVFKLKEILNCEVIGTDIADTAKKYGLLQHDFHEIKNEWDGKFDFVYTNSLDHAYDPEKAIQNWVKSLNERGILYIEHTDDHAGELDFADCFSAGFDDYIKLIGKYIKVIKVINIGDFYNEGLGYSIRNIRVIVASNNWEEEKSPLLSREDLLTILDNVGDLMFEDEETVIKCTSLLKENIERWAKAKCPVYYGKYIVTKDDLEDKQNWYVDDLNHESMIVKTSGTTTGVPFEYKRWLNTFHKIEWDYHYNVVLNEFDVAKEPHILYFFSDHYKKEKNKFIISHGGPSELTMNNHGCSRTAIIHYANFEMYLENPSGFFKYLFDYIQENPIDVFFTSAPQVNSLCNYIKKFKFKDKIGYLLSNTNERLLQNDASFLFVENNYFDHICDHMKCWDGGAMFFTCKHRNYHLTDNLCHVEEIDGKLVSTDFFNLASPFIRYWNGDYCTIKNKYERCECGRLFREFEFLQSRPFSLKGVCLKEIQERLKSLDISDIRQVRCSMDALHVISNRDLTIEEKDKISMLTNNFEFKFLTESDYFS